MVNNVAPQLTQALNVVLEGLNGRLPNQDLLRSFRRISRGTGGVPVILYDRLDPKEADSILKPVVNLLPTWIPGRASVIQSLENYLYFSANVLQQANYQARGIGSGTHALFHQWVLFTRQALHLLTTRPVSNSCIHYVCFARNRASWLPLVRTVSCSRYKADQH